MAFTIETVEREINGKRYRITKHGAKEGRRVLARLMQRFGDPIAALATMSGPAIGHAVAGFVKGFTPDEVDYFCNAFAPKTIVDADGVEMPLDQVFDIHFSGDYGAMLSWLVVCIEENFGGFFVELRERVRTGIERAMAEMMKAKAAQGSVSPMGSIGRSTGSPSPESTPRA